MASACLFVFWLASLARAQAYHLCFIALRELNELVKALAHLCKCFCLASHHNRMQNRGYSGDEEPNDGVKYSDSRLSARSASVDAILQTDLTFSRDLSAESLRQELFHFALRTIQHVPGVLDAGNMVVGGCLWKPWSCFGQPSVNLCMSFLFCTSFCLAACLLSILLCSILQLKLFHVFFVDPFTNYHLPLGNNDTGGTY